MSFVSEVRFENLRKLLKSMEENEWIIDSFLFKYKGENYVVILKVYSEKERKPSDYAKVKLEFIRGNNVKESIHAYADFWEVYFYSRAEFAKFFNINRSDANRDLFIDFSTIFAKFIPVKKIEEKSDLIRILQGSRCEGNNPNAIFCYAVKRNGSTNGHKNTRTIENSNKARTLRSFLYYKYREDQNLSFYFSPNPSDEKSDEEIICQVAKRLGK